MIFWVFGVGLLIAAAVLLLWPLLRPGKADDEHSERLTQNVSIAREKLDLLRNRKQQAEIDQQAYDEEFADLQMALALELKADENQHKAAGGAWMMPLVAVLVPVFSIAMYFVLGDYRVVQDPQIAEARQPDRQMTVDDMQVAIRAALKENPEDARGWYALGRTMMIKQDYDGAVAAFQRAYDLLGDQPAILFSLADALALNNDGNLLGEPEQLVKRGLELDPEFPNGLWLAGLAAEQRSDYTAAYKYWTKLLPLLQGDPQSRQQVTLLLQQLRQEHPELASIEGSEQLAVAPAGLSVSVALDTALSGEVNATDAVFVYAKAFDGPPMPLAVKRFTVADLPLEVSLSDADAMMPALKLSSFQQVVIGARVSPSGNPIAQPGDFYVESGAIDTTQAVANYPLMINQVR